MKRILSIDGGGSRGLFAIQILRKMETELKARNETLNSYFNLIAGTSTGAILAALIRKGMPLDQIESFYYEKVPTIFKGTIHHRYRFSASPLEKHLRDIFGAPPKVPKGHPIWEVGNPFENWSLGSPELLHPEGISEPRYLMLALMRADTLSPWVLTNHPDAKFNDPKLPYCNLQIPLWRLIKGSASAPFYFAPQLVQLPNESRSNPKEKVSFSNYYFVDGGVSGYNNPSFIAYRMATLEQHPFQWSTGPENLHIVSIGTGDFDSRAKRTRPDKLHMGDAAKGAIDYLMSAASAEQDYLTRMNAHCLTGPSQHGNGGSCFPAGEIDSEIGDLIPEQPNDPKYSYVRYQQTIQADQLQKWKHQKLNTKFVAKDKDSLNLFKSLGEKYAEEWFSPAHLL